MSDNDSCSHEAIKTFSELQPQVFKSIQEAIDTLISQVKRLSDAVRSACDESIVFDDTENRTE